MLFKGFVIISIFMKFLIISGSPRKGNTEFMLAKISELIKQKGHDTELILLRQKNICGCAGCLNCQNKREIKDCLHKDDAAELNQKLLDCDYVIIGSPCYFNNVSGLMKNWMDRVNPIYKKLKGKKGSVVCVGAAGHYSVSLGAQAIKNFYKINKMISERVLIAKGENENDVKDNIGFHKEIEGFVGKICNKLK